MGTRGQVDRLGVRDRDSDGGADAPRGGMRELPGRLTRGGSIKRVARELGCIARR